MAPEKFNFEVFTGRASHAVETPYVTFLSNGAKITLNNAAYEAAGKPEYAQLLFDRLQQVVGIQRTAKPTSHTYKVQKNTSSNSYTITAIAFIEYACISYAVSRRYEGTPIDGILTVDLKGKFEEVSKRRKTNQDPDESES